jgi:hypothetical protein
MFSAVNGKARSNTMTSMFDYDDSINIAFDAKIAGKSLVAAKHELLNATGDFFFLAHSDRELALRMQTVESDIEKIAHRKLANVSDSKAKLVRAVFDEWQLRHASCEFCKLAHETSLPPYTSDENLLNRFNKYRDSYNNEEKFGQCPSCGVKGPISFVTGAYGTCGSCDMGENPRNPDFGKKDHRGNPLPGSQFPRIPITRDPNRPKGSN